MASPDMPTLRAWLLQKLFESERALVAREQAADTWRNTSEETWKLVADNRQPTRGEKQRAAEMEERIAERIRADIEAIKALITITSGKE